MNVDRTYDVVFLALARDCAATLPSSLRALDAFAESGLNVLALIGENSSRDDTRSLLDAAAKASGVVRVVDTSFMDQTKGRLERMARGRQFLGDKLKELPVSTRAVCVIDLDEPFLESVSPGQLSATIRRVESNPNIFGISATSHPTYYDLLAYEDDARSFSDLALLIQASQRNPLQYYRLFKNYIYPAQESLTSTGGILCTSAFNGMAVYASDTYKQSSYLAEDDQWVCEHLTFNRFLRAATGKHMVVDPKLVLPTPIEHGRRSWQGFVWQRAKKFPARLAATIGRCIPPAKARWVLGSGGR